MSDGGRGTGVAGATDSVGGQGLARPAAVPGAQGRWPASPSRPPVRVSGVAATIGRAKFNGGDVDQDFITGVTNVGASMTVGPKYIYWGDGGATLQGGTAVGRADIDGANVNRHLLTAPASSGIAVYGNELYYASGLSGAGTIGRVDLDGARSQPNFIHVADDAFGLAIGPREG